jgi:hypothetical protein
MPHLAVPDTCPDNTYLTQPNTSEDRGDIDIICGQTSFTPTTNDPPVNG